MKNLNKIIELLTLLGMNNDEELLMKLYTLSDSDTKIPTTESKCFQTEPDVESKRPKTADTKNTGDTFIISTDLIILDMIVSHVLEHIKTGSDNETSGSDVVSTLESFARFIPSFNFVETSFCKIAYALNGILRTNVILDHCYIDKGFICSDHKFHTIFDVHVDIVPVLMDWIQLRSVHVNYSDKTRLYDVIQAMHSDIDKVLMLECEKRVQPIISSVYGNVPTNYLIDVLLRLRELYLGNESVYKLTLRRKETEIPIQDTDESEDGDIDDLLCDFAESLVGDATVAATISNDSTKETSETILSERQDLTYIPEFIQRGNIRVAFDYIFAINEYMTDLTIQIPCNKNFSEHPFRIGQLIFSVIDGNNGHTEFANLIISNKEAYANYWKDISIDQKRPKLYKFEKTSLPLFDEHTCVYFGVVPSRMDYPKYRIHIRIRGMCAKKYPVSFGVTYIEEK